MTENNKLNGLGGWLLLVGFGVVLSPLRQLAAYVPIYKPIFEDGTWETLTTVGLESHIPFWGSLVLGEIAFNSALVIASIWLIYLFFAKHFLFPKVYIAIIIASLIIIPLDSWLVSLIFPDEPIFDTETASEFTKVFIAGSIWIPYMLVSKRVKATFVAGRPSEQI